MCQIWITKSFSAKAFRAIEREAKIRNPDGWGIAQYNRGKWIRQSSFEGQISYVERVPTIVHWRMATCGVVDDTNAQPFTISQRKIVLAHNGHISGLLPFEKLGFGNRKEPHSDSYLVSRIVEKYGIEILSDPFFAGLFSGQKFAIGLSNGSIVKLGHWAHSNLSASQFPTKKYQLEGYWNSKDKVWIPFKNVGSHSVNRFHL